MRARHVIAVVTVIFVGVGIKLVSFTLRSAEADSLALRSAGVDTLQLHQGAKNLPVQKLHDMSLAFPDAN